MLPHLGGEFILGTEAMGAPYTSIGMYYVWEIKMYLYCFCF